MKRIPDKQQYRRFQESRAQRTLIQRTTRPHRVSASKARGYRRARDRPVTPGYARVVAPSILSMRVNPEATIRFFDSLLEYYHRNQAVFVSMRHASRIDYDAIVVLLSVMIRLKSAGIPFYGDIPKDPSVRSLLIKSGFFQNLYRRFEEQDRYTLGQAHSIHTHGSRSVDPARSAEVIERATTTVWGIPRRSQGIQRVLLELMQNTNNHASPRLQGEKHWWLSVHHQKKAQRASFVFVDLGIGVLQSLDNKPHTSKWFAWRSKALTILTVGDNVDVLRYILGGQLHQTVTGQPFRGKGLPGINEVAERNWISNLLIVTNDVYADVSNKDFHALRNPFGGTLVSWDVSTANKAT
jgi:hypothetical protein